MDNEVALRLIVRRKLAVPRSWGGPLDGEECDVCETVVRADQLLVEGISTETNQERQFHVECFYSWDSERDVLGRGMDAAAGDE